MRRCTRPSEPAAPPGAFSQPTWTGSPSNGWRPPRRCAARSPTTRCGCITSRRSGPATAPSTASRRWHDPDLGEISPAKFIPLAEECGLIEQIGLWSIREACRQMAAWRHAGLDIPCVSVNLSPINFQNVNLAAAVAAILADHGLPPDALMLEITEGVFLNERAVAVETMNRLRELGIGLSLDD